MKRHSHAVTEMRPRAFLSSPARRTILVSMVGPVSNRNYSTQGSSEPSRFGSIAPPSSGATLCFFTASRGECVQMPKGSCTSCGPQSGSISHSGLPHGCGKPKAHQQMGPQGTPEDVRSSLPGFTWPSPLIASPLPLPQSKHPAVRRTRWVRSRSSAHSSWRRPYRPTIQSG